MTLPVIKLPVTWSLPNSGITFNTGTPDSTGCTYYILDTVGWDEAPPPQPLLTNQPFAPGAYRAPNYFAPRIITIHGVILAPANNGVARRQAERMLNAAFMSPTTPQPLTCVEEDQTLTCNVENDAKSTITPLRRDISDFTLQVVAADPRKYALLAQSTGQTALPSTTGGLVWPLVWSPGLNWGTVVSSGQFQLTNPGTAPSWPTFVVSALGNPLNSPGVTISINNSVLQYTGSLGANDVLMINTDPLHRSVTIGGADRRPFLTTAQWTAIPGGSSATVSFSASNYTSTATLAGSLYPAYW